MTAPSTATVETLTAEVRCLQVGSRQVTLSVYRQLDPVPVEEMSVFGRVRAERDLPAGAIELVGSHSGALCRSTVPYPQRWDLEIPSAIQHWLYHDRSQFHGNTFQTTYNGRALSFQLRRKESPYAPLVCVCPSCERCEANPIAHASDLTAEHLSGNHCHADGLTGLGHEAAAAIERTGIALAKQWAMYNHWSSLPLIVLAGLK